MEKIMLDILLKLFFIVVVYIVVEIIYRIHNKKKGE